MHSSGQIVERFYAVQRCFYAGQAVADELREVLAEDVVWHVPGRSAIAGEYRGVDEVLAYFARRRDRAGETFLVTGRGMLAEGERVVHFADGEAELGGVRRSWRTVGIFRIAEGRIAECWLLPFDQYEFDEIWA
ncbi:MAG: nuclear transport factor 2 family protein [Actinobacteria bacterium]|nr:MAG: nuclear transport factor 2 family protein [Actinomycetota bacterium]